MRSIWKGHIRFLLVAIPVRVYNAIETSETDSPQPTAQGRLRSYRLRQAVQEVQ